MMTENLPNTRRKVITYGFRKLGRTPNRIYPKKLTPRYIRDRLLKTKQKMLKTTRKKQCLTYKRKAGRVVVDFSSETPRPEGICIIFFNC